MRKFCAERNPACSDRRNRGAAIVFALFGLMIAAMVSMVVVGAAWMNAQRVGNLRDEEQAYLTVTSAANIVYDAVADRHTAEERMRADAAADFSISRAEVEVETTDGGTAVLHTFYAKDDGSGYQEFTTGRTKEYSFSKAGVPAASDTMKNAIRRTVWALAREVDTSGAKQEATISLAVADQARMTATLLMQMDESYNLTMTISSECGDGAKKAKYEMVMRCYASQIKHAEIQNLTLTIGTGTDAETTTAPRKVTIRTCSWPAEMISAQKKTEAA